MRGLRLLSATIGFGLAAMTLRDAGRELRAAFDDFRLGSDTEQIDRANEVDQVVDDVDGAAVDQVAKEATTGGPTS